MNDTIPYNTAFFQTRNERTIHAAHSLLSICLEAMPKPMTAVDLGCGVGTWLSVLAKNGTEVLGVDGPWVEERHLVIPRESFRQADLSKPLNLGRKFDFALSLEVAEHLPPTCSGQFIDSLTDLADFVLFSAAIPHQGGVGHLNEQWPEYWAKLFNQRGFVAYDFLRPRIWSDQAIPVWYRQNTVFYVKANRASELLVTQGASSASALNLVHPETYASLTEPAGFWPSLVNTSSALRRAISRRIRG